MLLENAADPWKTGDVRSQTTLHGRDRHRQEDQNKTFKAQHGSRRHTR
jgi:hypothetical protein